MSTIYTVGDGKRTQMSMRDDGVWFVRTKWHGVWDAWREHGRARPYEFGVYVAPGMGQAKLPDVAV